MELNGRIHPSVVALLLQHNIWIPDENNLTESQKKKNATCREAGCKWWPAVLKTARQKNRADYSDKERNRKVVHELLSMLIKNQETGWWYFYPEYYLSNKPLCYEFFTAWQLRINKTRKKKDGWCWHWHIVGDHRIKMMEIK